MARLSIPDEPTFSTFTVTSPTTVFPFDFSIFAKADLTVYVDGEPLEQSDFTLTATVLEGGGYSGGTITLKDAVDDVTVRIERNVAPVRSSQFAPSASVPVQSIDMALNRLTAVQQDIERKKLSAPANPVAGSFLAYNASGVLVSSSGTGADAGLRTDLAAAAGGDLIAYDDGGDDATILSMAEYLRAMPIYAIAYGVVPDGTDVSAAMATVIERALSSGRELVLPAGVIRLDAGTNVYLTEALTYKTAFRKGLRMRGAGSGRTIIDSRVASDWLFDVSVGDGAGGEFAFAEFAAGLGGCIEGLTIRNGSATVASNGIRLRAQYQFTIRDVHIVGLSGTGIKLRCSLGDLDGNNQVLLEDVRIEDCAVWGNDLGTDSGHNENSFTTCRRVFVQNCGTAEQKNITGITKAAAGVVSCVGHGFTNGTQIFIGGVAGMTEVNSYNYEAPVTVTVINADSFSINVNTTGFGTYTSGGHAFPRTPSSGATRVKGQITTFQSCGWTINKNRSVWIDGEGTLPSDVFFYDSTIENPQLIGMHVQGNRTLMAHGLHVYFNAVQAGGPEYWGHLYDGVSNVVSDITIRGAVVRSTNASGEADVHTFQGFGANYYRDTVRIETQTLHVKQFGFGNQVMFKGISFDPVPQQCSLIVTGGTEIRLLPDQTYPSGSVMPIRASYGGSGGAVYSTGPWVAATIPASGITLSNAGLTADTTYYVYLYAQATTLNAPALELSTAVPVRASDGSGYPVKTGDQTRLAICRPDGAPVRVRTDSGGTPQFVTTNSGWMAPVRLGGESVGTRSALWQSSADAKLRVKTNSSLPNSVADANYEYWASSEVVVAAFDPASVAAGASVTIDVTLASTPANAHIRSVSFSTGFGGLDANGVMKAANTMSLTLSNYTASPIDLASGTLYVERSLR